MGYFQDQIKKFIQPIVGDAVKSVATDLAKADRPSTTEVPSIMQVGQMFTGGARRKHASAIDFDTLRTFSKVYDVARVCINHRKRQIANLEWSIVPTDPKADVAKYQKRIDEVTAFFKKPCHAHNFKKWTDKMLEDLLVLDAAVLWKDRTYGGQLKELLPVDGTTIRIKVSEDGTMPEPPEVAYQQVLFGEVKGEYTTDEMYYEVINPRNDSPYGLSPLECLIIGVDAALRSQMYNSNLLSEGTVPEGFLSMPDTWTPDQIKTYQVYFDSMMAGNLTQTSRIRMIPGGKGVGYVPTKKAEDMRMLEFEKWLLMKTCAMFDVQPEAIGFVENVTSSTGKSQHQMGNERGLIPLANFLKMIFTDIITNDFGYSDLKFEWMGLQVVDTEFELQRAQMMLEHGALKINEYRIEQGYDPLDDEAADKAMVYTGSGPLLLESVGETPESTAPGAVKPDDAGATAGQNDAENELKEMEKWEQKALNYIKRGKGTPEFKADFIDRAAYSLIAARLSVAKSKEEIKIAFSPFKNDAMERSLISRAVKVKDDISAFKRKKYESFGSSK